MAPTNEYNVASGSPGTSEGIESLRGTPATKLSQFSPDEAIGELKLCSNSINRANVPPSFNLSRANPRFVSNGNVNASPALGSADPFVSGPHLSTTTRGTNSSKLSPIASTFTPATAVSASFSYVNNKSNGTSPVGGLSQPAAFQNNNRAVAFNTPSSFFSPKNNIVGKNNIVVVPPGFDLSPASFKQGSPLRSELARAGIVDAAFVKLGQFSMDNRTSRVLKVSNIAPNTPVSELDAFFDSNVFTTLQQFVLNELDTAGNVFLKFGDIRDADKAALKVNHTRPQWHADCVEPRQFSTKYGAGGSNVSRFEGQIRIAAILNGPEERFDVGSLSRVVKELLEEYGEVVTMMIDERGARAIYYRAEFFNATIVKTAVRAMNHRDLAFCTLRLSPHEPDLELEGAQQQRSTKVPEPLIVGREPSLNKALGIMSIDNQQRTFAPVTPVNQVFPSHSFGTPYSGALNSRYNPSVYRTPSSMGSFIYGPSGQLQNPSAFSTPTHNPYHGVYALTPMFNAGAIGQERGTTPRRHKNNIKQQYGQGKTLGRKSHDQGPHNIVNIYRIQNGADVRTTIMLRNIPNKIGYDMLKDIIDETSRGKYDFMYLRIDFANNCNVGYAFINFEDPLDIIEFVLARAGRRWNCFNSDKIAEVSYATIQGKDCLVQKFRNSSVMLEHPDFRPKIFCTGDGPMGGKEQKFPTTDNTMKMRRSIANAEHIGLFAPRVGQNFRDEQRRRNSQYDRGTRHAVIEDSYNRNHHGYPNAPKNFHAPAQYGQIVPYYPPFPGPRY